MNGWESVTTNTGELRSDDEIARELFAMVWRRVRRRRLIRLLISRLPK